MIYFINSMVIITYYPATSKSYFQFGNIHAKKPFKLSFKGEKKLVNWKNTQLTFMIFYFTVNKYSIQRKIHNFDNLITYIELVGIAEVEKWKKIRRKRSNQ